MIKKSLVLLFIGLLNLFPSYSQNHRQEGPSIHILSDRNQTANDPEYRALVISLSALFQGAVSEMSPENLVNGIQIAERDIIWIYKNDTTPVQHTYSKKELKRLKSYIRKGGKVLLANQATLMLGILGLEPDMPETRLKKSKDEGYGRRLGYHAFLSHPLFEDMNGGAYVLKPEKDISLLQTGYFGKYEPCGKVIAVDWDYIFLREDSRMILEYQYGQGKVLAVGGYLIYNLPNRNRVHLDKFTRNLVAYLSGEHFSSRACYWRSGPSEAIEKPFVLEESAPNEMDIVQPVPLNDRLKIGPVASEFNYWDLAGERILLMGTDTGGITEIWATPCLSIRDLQVSYAPVSSADRIELKDIGRSGSEVTVLPASYQRRYNLTGDLTGDLTGRLVETISASPNIPAAVITYQYSGRFPVRMEFSFTLLFRLMWPYSEKVLGDLNYSWNEDLGAVIATDESGEFATIVGIQSGKKNEDAILDLQLKASFANDPGKPEEITHQRCTLHIESRGPVTFNMIVASSSEGLEKTAEYYSSVLKHPGKILADAENRADSLMNESLTIKGPDTVFNAGFTWAKIAADRFRVSTPGLGTSLVAGYATSDNGWDGEHAVSGRPGYGWYFGRDGEWSGFAVLHYGDFETVKQMLLTFQRFQDLNGKIFHELSTSGIAHYDASDATPLFVVLAGRYLRHSGDSAFIRQIWPSLMKAMDFCYSTDTDGDKLIENTNVGHGWVEGGHLFGSHTSLYLASCWAAALEEGAYIAEILGNRDIATKYRQDALVVKVNINLKFWNPSAEFYYHGIFQDGSFKDDLSIMPAIPILFGQADPRHSGMVIPVIASNAFTTDWGCRIVPQNDPHFNPRGYHTGSVWPLFTGWASLAGYKSNHFLQAYSQLYSNLNIWQYWGLGFCEEVLHGEIFKPAGVCHHQCWSETMALQPSIEGMLGYQPDAPSHKLKLKPWFPADWDSVQIENIRIGEERIQMLVQREVLKTTYIFKKGTSSRLDVQLQPVLPPGSVIESITVNGQPARDWGVRETSQGWVIPEFGFWLESSAIVEIDWHGGITALPLLTNPIPGESSKGFRILATAFSDNTYTITLQAPRASWQEFRIWSANPEAVRAEGAEIIQIEGDIIRLKTSFADLETDYVTKEVIMHW